MFIGKLTWTFFYISNICERVYPLPTKERYIGALRPDILFCITNEKVIMKDRMQDCDYNSEPVYQ